MERLLPDKTIFNNPLLIYVLIVLFSLKSYSQRTDNYLPILPDVKFEKTNLPIIFIDTDGRIIQKDNRILVRMKVINSQIEGENYRDTIAHPNQHFDYDGYVKIKYRGNSSFRLSDKKPYSIHLVNSDGSKRKASLIGMPEHNDWALLSLYIDKSMLREALTFTLAQGYFDYVPRVRYCELILDGVYYGVFLLIERIRCGEGRLDLDKPGDDGEALTGGYLVEIDRNDSPGYTSKYLPVSSDGLTTFENKPVYFQYKDPDEENLTDEQKKYLHSQIDVFEDALASPDFKSPETGYRKHIDVTSFIDYQLTQEVTNNCDAYRLSTNLYKCRDNVDSRFKMTIWDFDRAWGKSRNIGYMTDIWAYQNNDRLTPNDDTFVPFWWSRLMQDDSYVGELKARWAQYRKGNYSDKHINETLDSLISELTVEGALERNNLAWPQWGEYKYPEYYVAESFDDEVNWLRDWISARLKWMDEQLLSTTFIKNSKMTKNSKEQIYSPIGIRRKVLSKGINIIWTSDGKTIKRIVR